MPGTPTETTLYSQSFCQLEHAGDHLLGGELVAGDEAPPLVEAVEERLHVRAADVDREHVGRTRLDRILALAHDGDPAAAASAMTSAFAGSRPGRRGSTVAGAQATERVDLVLAGRRATGCAARGRAPGT